MYVYRNKVIDIYVCVLFISLWLGTLALDPKKYIFNQLIIGPLFEPFRVMMISIKSSFRDPSTTTSNEETSLQDSLVILKRPLQN